VAEKSLETEVHEILKCIAKNKNFILTGGAGSGKTYSLISLIDELTKRYPTKTIACITYTNNAVAEIRSRSSNEKLWVSTIHEFIWDIIKNFQLEMKETITELINDDEICSFSFPTELIETNTFDMSYFANCKISYDEYYFLQPEKESKIGHDQILILAEKMFEKYSKLCDILKDRANLIFVDEYQDTDPSVEKILLEHINKSNKKCIVGFFGDSMQAIYDSGIGAITNKSVTRVDKQLNRRNPLSVITLANKFRDDGLEQKPSDDEKATNMKEGKVILGKVQFVYGTTLDELDLLKKTNLFSDWDFNSKETKELWLVHKANAKMAGFETLYKLYNSDSIIELIGKIRKKIKNDPLIINDDASFESVLEKVEITKGRGKNKILFTEDPQFITGYKSIYNRLKDELWGVVRQYRINADSLLSYKFNGLTDSYEAKSSRDRILRKLDSIYELIELYENKDYNTFLRKTGIKVRNSNDKKILYDGMMKLVESKDKQIAEIIKISAEVLGNHSSEAFNTFISEQGAYLWEQIKSISFTEYIKSIEYQKEYLPFATQHSIKGSEYDNILVVLDNQKWTKYNFKSLFSDNKQNENVYNRTKKLFYVCITRAKQNLMIFMPENDSEIISNVEEVFGKTNVINAEDYLRNRKNIFPENAR